MKSLFLFVCLGLAVVIQATGQTMITRDVPQRLEQIPGYTDVISDNRVLLVYEPGMPLETLHGWLKDSRYFDTRQPAQALAPGRFLARMAPGKTWRNVAEGFGNVPHMTAVTPWLKDAGGNERGILTQVYVKPKTDDTPDFLYAIAAQYGGRNLGERKDMPGIWELEFNLQSPFNAWEMALFLNRQPEVEFADINFVFFPKVHTDDSLYARQWALQNVGGGTQWNGTPGADMDLVNAWTITTGDPSIRVAILDSGVDTLHPDLIPNLLPGYDATGNGSQGYPNNSNFQMDGHGTACAGIVAAKGNNQIGVAGVAYDCKIIPIKVFYYIDTTIVIPGFIDTTLHEIPYSETDYIVNATNWAWQTGQADVLSNSWGIPADLLPFAPIDQPLINQALLDASQQGRNGKGAVSLFSSGNDNGAVIWPGTQTSVISVGATTNKDKRASFSNYGTGLDVSAPGVQITTTDRLGNSGFASGDYSLDFGGTSAACPHAAGVAALVLSEYPDLTFAQVRSALRVSAERVGGYPYATNTVDGTWGPQLGYGRLNAHQALLAVPVLSVTESKGSVSAVAFPNPATAQMTVWLHGLPQTWVQYDVVDMTGKKVMQGRVFSATEDYSMPLSVDGLSAGLYHVRLQAGEALLALKFVKN